MRATRRLAVVAIAVACAVAPAAMATSEPEVLTTTFESWYQPDPTCDVLGTCLAATELPVSPPAEVPTSPYPEGTLHVSWAGAVETARSYISFPLFRASGPIATAVLDVPLDTVPENGDAVSESSTVMACLATGILENAAGSFAPPPEVDCTDAVLLTHVAEPVPHLTGDLSPLVAGLRSATGIALLPDAVNSGQDAWHVVFSSHRRSGAGPGPPTLTVTIAATAPSSPTVDVPVTVVEQGGIPGTPNQSTVGGVVPVPLAPRPGPAPEVAQDPAPSTDPAPVALPAAADDTGQSYPEVFLLPLLLLVLVPFVGRSLTSELRTDL